jgi:hypothetical protein
MINFYRKKFFTVKIFIEKNFFVSYIYNVFSFCHSFCQPLCSSFREPRRHQICLRRPSGGSFCPAHRQEGPHQVCPAEAGASAHQVPDAQQNPDPPEATPEGSLQGVNCNLFGQLNIYSHTGKYLVYIIYINGNETKQVDFKKNKNCS